MPLPLRFLLLTVLLGPGHARAVQSDIGATLPDLPLPRSSQVTRFDANPGGVTLGYADADQGWGALASRPSGTDTALQLTYGSVLSEGLGAGVHLQVRPRQSEVVLNGIYDPASDLRLHLAVGQLRSSNTYQFVFGDYAKSVAQSSYLMDVRKYWAPGSLLRDFGASAYQAGTRERGAEQTMVHPDGTGRLATGMQQGYMLNLSLAPSPRSKLDFGRGMDSTEYAMADGAGNGSGNAVRQASYTQYLDDCLQVRGGYRGNAWNDEVQLDMTRGSWQVGLSRQTLRDGGDSTVAVKMGYSIPLGVKHNVAKCRSTPRNTAAFAPVFKAVTARPDKLPSAPMAQVDSSVP
ncbi:hypothetical protein QN362_11500 [Actimicrobium sp. CCC2.4]|nr:hypothetical protein [Actimicrobium sp. CCC2.4]